MLAITTRRGIFALALIAIAILAALLAGTRGSSALGLQATWTMTGRADATSFRPGPQLPASGRLGFEVISFGAAGPAAALESYRYAGADAVAEGGAPTRPFVTCDASASAGALTLSIGNAFPYAGCVYFPRVDNTGDRPIEVDLGSFTHPSGIFCGLTTCKVDIVAGGLNHADLASTCLFEGPVAATTNAALKYRLDPGAALTCPIFVVLLQPAAEAATYSVTIEAPRPQAVGADIVEVAGVTPPVGPSGVTAAVAALTPQPPRTGFGLVVGPEDAQASDGTAVLAVVSFLALVGALFVVGAPRRRARDEEATAASER